MYEFFTAKSLERFRHEAFYLEHYRDRENLALLLNEILDDQMETYYTSRLPEDEQAYWEWDHPSKEKLLQDTHKIHFITEPLEEEKDICDHQYGVIYDDKGTKITAIHAYCPNCGEEL